MRLIKHHTKLLLLTTLAISATSAAPFQNGSFETGPTAASPFITLSAGDTSIPGWTVTNGSIDYILSFWNAADGTRSVDLDGNEAGGVAQTFDTIVGHSYLVTFALAGNPDGGPTVKNLRVSAAAASNNYSFDVTGKTRTNMGWVDDTFNFIAAGTSSTLTFTSLDPPANFWGPALDNVRLADVSGVPEPASLLLAGGAFIAFALVRKRKY